MPMVQGGDAQEEGQKLAFPWIVSFPGEGWASYAGVNSGGCGLWHTACFVGPGMSRNSGSMVEGP